MKLNTYYVFLNYKVKKVFEHVQKKPFKGGAASTCLCVIRKNVLNFTCSHNIMRRFCQEHCRFQKYLFAYTTGIPAIPEIPAIPFPKIELLYVRSANSLCKLL